MKGTPPLAPQRLVVAHQVEFPAGLPTLIGAGAGAAGMISNERLGRVVEAAIGPGALAQMISGCIMADRQARKSAYYSLWRQERRRVSAKCDFALVMGRYLELIENCYEQQKN